MKKTIAIIAAAALTMAFSGAAMAGYPDKVSAAPYNGTIDAAQPYGESTAPKTADDWNVPVELQNKGDQGAKGAAAEHQPQYKQGPSSTDHWNVPKEFGK